MSVCDEGWKPEGEEDWYQSQCPCLNPEADNEAGIWKCNLNVFEAHDQYMDNDDGGAWEYQDLRPTTCQHAQALNAVLEDPQLELATLDPGRQRCR